MAENTKIQWADHTFNPWRGCTKIAPGCANCYADAQSKRNQKTLGIWGPNGTRVVASEAMWREPLKWNRNAGAAHKGRKASISGRDDGEVQAYESVAARPRVFCASLADVFEDWPGRPTFSPEKIDGEEVSPVAWYGPVKTPAGIVDQVCRTGQMLGSGIGSSFQVWMDRYRPATLDNVRSRLFRLIDETPNLDWLLLTKRPENILRMLPIKTGRRDAIVNGKTNVEAWRRDNVWLGTSIACQEDADRNVPELLKCRDLAAKLFLSIEPLVGPVDLWPWFAEDHPCSPDWVIVGGESGPNARPCDIAWIRAIVRQCQSAGTRVFVKQVGARPRATVYDSFNGEAIAVDEWRGLLRDPKGGDPEEWPTDIRVREVPV